MKKISWSILFILMVMPFSGITQAGDLSQLVSFHYAAVPLGDALTDISSSYNVKFSYSEYYVPLDQKVTVHLDNEPLSAALLQLFQETGIEYRPIGGQLVLKVVRDAPINQKPGSEDLSFTVEGKTRFTTNHTPDPENRKQSGRKEQEDAGNIIFRAPGWQRKDEVPPERIKTRLANAKIPQALVPLEPPRLSELSLDKPPEPVLFEKIKDLALGPEAKPETSATKIGQLSLLPKLGTHLRGSEELLNRASANILWGKNGGVEGFEIGGLVNEIRYSVNGAQLAGIGNVVGGHVEGVQIAGLFNVVRGKISGFQSAGLINSVGEESNAVQIAGIANFSGGGAGTQIAGLMNVAGDVRLGQISGLYNKAGHVEQFQIGLINVSDSISGIPLGLINIVKAGNNSYNRLELSGADVLYLNVSLKFGAKRFYNVVQLGSRPENGSNSWGLGYGIGSTFPLSSTTLINTELVALHINEKERWTRGINLLNQLRVTWDYRLGRKASVFAGPTVNIFLSNRYEADTGRFGTQLAPYTLFDNQNINSLTNHPINVKIWVGLQYGLRF